MLDIESLILAWQVCWQTWPFVLHLRCPGLRRKPGFGPRKVSVEVFQGELQLIAVKLLGSSAKLVALKLFDDEIEALDLGLR